MNSEQISVKARSLYRSWYSRCSQSDRFEHRFDLCPGNDEKDFHRRVQPGIVVQRATEKLALPAPLEQRQGVHQGKVVIFLGEFGSGDVRTTADKSM